MNKLFKNVIIAAVVLPLTFTSVYAKQRHQGNGNAMPMRGMLQQVDLTSEQKIEIDTILQTNRPQMGLRQDRGVFHEQQMTILKAKSFSKAKANDLINAQHALRKEMQLKRMEVMFDVYHALTPEQQAKMDLLFSQRQGRMGNKGRGMHRNR